MNRLEALMRENSIRALDYMLARALARSFGEESEAVILAAALASQSMQNGHTCLDLSAIAGKPWPMVRADATVKSDFVKLPAFDDWQTLLSESPLCDTTNSTLPDHGHRPFVLVDQHRLYVRRFYQYEQQIVAKLGALAQDAGTTGITFEDQREIDTLLPSEDQKNTLPRQAAMIALTRRLLILSGGPGTGKTFTMARLLQLLHKKAERNGQPLEVKLAAPTGKAAMRMRESIQNAKKPKDGLMPVSGGLSEDASTLHRLLGPIHNSPYFKHNAESPLTSDIVIIDEASMIDLPMMAKLLTALKQDAKLILLGDMNQLSSVEPGYVLGDICLAAQTPGSLLHGTLVELTTSNRFDGSGPVGQLSAALQQAGTSSDPEGAKAWRLASMLSKDASAFEGGVKTGDRIILHGTPAELKPSAKPDFGELQRLVLAGYADFMNSSTVKDAFGGVAQFRILCALRRGPYGVENLNRLVERILAHKHLDEAAAGRLRKLNPSGRFYDHRLLMITRNNPGMKLFNGDIGVILPETANGDELDTEGKNNLVAWFEQGENETAEDGTVLENAGSNRYRAIPCNMLPEHETAFAMTIHKSQGSEFTNILLLFPTEANPVLTKELLYTGITRVVREIQLWCNEDIFKAAAVKKTDRASGLTRSLIGSPASPRPFSAPISCKHGQSADI